MINFFSDETRRNPYPAYEQARIHSPLLKVPGGKLWMLFDYDGVRQVLADHDKFSSRHGPAEWIIFLDPPRHTKLRALISQAFTPRSVANLEPRIRELSGELLDEVTATGEMDLVDDFSVPLPTLVIGEMLGIPAADRGRCKRWNDVILKLSYTIGNPNAAEAAAVAREFEMITLEMNDYLAALLAQRRAEPRDDLLTRLRGAEVDGQRLSQAEILGLFQLLLLAGSETTTNLINNAVLCLLENPDQFVRLQNAPHLLPSMIEEVLRYRAPLQWMLRLARHEVELHGHLVPAGDLILPMIGAANRDPRQFPDPNRFDITRHPNPHLAFGQGIHFCLGAALARLESKIALTELFSRVKNFRRTTDEPWEPRKGLHVHGPTHLPLRFESGKPRGD